MILDSQALFSDQQAITSTALSTNVFDKKVAKRFLGAGPPMQLVCLVTETFASGGASTLTVTLENDDDVAIGSSTVLFSTVAIPKATLVLGYEILIPTRPFDDILQYLALRYTVATGPFTAGKIVAGFTLPGRQNRNFL